jgi:uncharacterized protein (TIGR02231 family)
MTRLEAERSDAARERTRIQRNVERLAADVERARALAAQWRDALSKAPAGLADEARARGFRESYDLVVARHEAVASRLQIERRALRDAERALQRAERALADGAVERPSIEAFARVQLAASEAGEVELSLTYRVPCALWRPEHTARLESAPSDDSGGEPASRAVRWTTAAVLWQRTGERWEDVELTLSTARPARAASPPLLREERLALRKKTEHERQRVVVDAREQTVAVAGLDRGARAVSEMPGVDDGGEPVSLSPAERVTIPSTGKPVRVDVLAVSLEAAVDRVVYPERSAAAHVRATMTWRASVPLLAGPVRVALGPSLVGRGRVGFSAQGEPFELGFGADDAVRVRRHVDETRDTVMVLGTQRVRRVVNVWVSNLSGAARGLKVIERVPVSEIADVEVQLGAHEGWRHEPRDGMLERDVRLDPQSGKKLTFEYELRAGAKVDLPG